MEPPGGRLLEKSAGRLGGTGVPDGGFENVIGAFSFGYWAFDP